ncbi:TPA: hypothetical protein P1M42_000020 [Clostridioides difficile]|uniref:Uncharacterized protein n=2 Tax=Clostridioides difficile TaxID=1496 RepID=A0A9X8RLL9_CLODI|nr:hypothetical protein [Clostridioides difficile]AKP44687.1 hypothetical protein CDIF1296T_phi013 [Peptoclostridium phage phiCDIF1296T]CCL66956.1 hypothetical protein BN183_3680013 [Clostridioides difficile E7]ARC17042.1 hypothetical protein A6J95_20025 [Clostridioides difficile]AVI14360.1 hypothetical protein C4J70_19220 [Clostridioides difficile]EGT3659623.1 hypothetical protein [Clostridioides difficile]
MKRFAVKDAGNVIVKDKVTGEVLFYSQDLNAFNFKLDSESVYAKAKGANTIAFDGAITASLTMEQEVIQMAQLAMLLSSDIDEKTAKVGKRKVLTSDSTKKVTLENIKPVANSISVYSIESDGISIIKKLQFTSSVTGANTEITISTADFNAGDKVAVFYLEEIPKAKVVKIKEESTAPNYVVEAEVMVKTVDGEYMVLYMSVPNAKAQRSIELNLTAENPSGFNMTLDVLPDENKEYATFTFIGDENLNPARMASMLGVELEDEKDTKPKK